MNALTEYHFSVVQYAPDWYFAVELGTVGEPISLVVPIGFGETPWQAIVKLCEAHDKHCLSCDDCVL